jgi:hypothetical protein
LALVDSSVLLGLHCQRLDTPSALNDWVRLSVELGDDDGLEHTEALDEPHQLPAWLCVLPSAELIESKRRSAHLRHGDRQQLELPGLAFAAHRSTSTIGRPALEAALTVSR